MKKIFLMSLSLALASWAHASQMKEEKFSFDGLSKKHPVTIELESVEYRAKGVELHLKVVNNSDVGVDFSKASFDIITGNQKGFIKESDFDGFTIQPKSKRLAKISFGFDETLTPSFLKERSNGTSTIKIENILNFKNQKVPAITLKNY